MSSNDNSIIVNIDKYGKSLISFNFIDRSSVFLIINLRNRWFCSIYIL